MKIKLAYGLILIGIILILLKIVDFILPGEALIPFLTLMGTLFILLGLLLLVKTKSNMVKKVERGNKVKNLKKNMKNKSNNKIKNVKRK